MKALFAQIPKPSQGRRFVIADIHGCSQTFKKLVEDKIQLQKEDQLFLLGDYINRGPDSVGVINFIFELQKNKFQLYPLRGNHEQMLLDAHHSGFSFFGIGLPRLQKRETLTDSWGNILPDYLNFFKELPYYYDTGDFYIVHAGINFAAKEPLLDYESMLWMRHIQADLAFLDKKKIVHGHTVTGLSVIKESIKEQKAIIPLDNGCYMGLRQNESSESGNLCALNLDTFELLIQENVDK